MKFLSSKKLVYLGFFLVALIGISVGLYTDSTFLIVSAVKIETIKPVNGRNALHPLIQKEVHSRIKSKLHSFRGVNIFAVPIARLQQHILSDVWVESVVIERKLPHQLQVYLKLKSVVLVYLDQRGQFLPVSDQGQLLNPVSPHVVPDVPLVRNFDIIKNPELLKQILALYHQLPETGILSQSTISEVDWSRSEGLIVENSTPESGRIVLGIDNVSAKAVRVNTVLKYLESQNQKWRVIDASFRKKVLVRLRKHS